MRDAPNFIQKKSPPAVIIFFLLIAQGSFAGDGAGYLSKEICNRLLRPEDETSQNFEQTILNHIETEEQAVEFLDDYFVFSSPKLDDAIFDTLLSSHWKADGEFEIVDTAIKLASLSEDGQGKFLHEVLENFEKYLSGLKWVNPKKATIHFSQVHRLFTELESLPMTNIVKSVLFSRIYGQISNIALRALEENSTVVPQERTIDQYTGEGWIVGKAMGSGVLGFFGGLLALLSYSVDDHGGAVTFFNTMWQSAYIFNLIDWSIFSLIKITAPKRIYKIQLGLRRATLNYALSHTGYEPKYLTQSNHEKDSDPDSRIKALREIVIPKELRELNPVQSNFLGDLEVKEITDAFVKIQKDFLIDEEENAKAAQIARDLAEHPHDYEFQVRFKALLNQIHKSSNTEEVQKVLDSFMAYIDRTKTTLKKLLLFPYSGDVSRLTDVQIRQATLLFNRINRKIAELDEIKIDPVEIKNQMAELNKLWQQVEAVNQNTNSQESDWKSAAQQFLMILN